MSVELRSAVVALVVVLVLGGPCFSAENPFTISGRAAQDKNFIRDLDWLDLVAIAKSKAVWVVAEVTIDPKSNIPSGEMIPPFGPDSKLVEKVFFAGKVKVLGVVRGKGVQKEWDFRWDNPTFRRGNVNLALARNLSPSMHLHNGTFLLEVQEGEPGEKQFSTIVEIPDEQWTGYLLEAVDTVNSHDDIFSAQKVEERVGALSALCGGKNPLLALTAFRTLKGAGLGTIALAEKAMRDRPFVVQALVVDLLMVNMKAEEVDPAFRMVSSVIRASKDIRVAEGVAAGVAFGHTPKGAGREFAEKVISEISGTVSGLGGPRESHEAVRKILEMYGLSRK